MTWLFQLLRASHFRGPGYSQSAQNLLYMLGGFWVPSTNCFTLQCTLVHAKNPPTGSSLVVCTAAAPVPAQGPAKGCPGSGPLRPAEDIDIAPISFNLLHFKDKTQCLKKHVTEAHSEKYRIVFSSIKHKARKCCHFLPG